jgi:Ferritin-like domain
MSNNLTRKALVAGGALTAGGVLVGGPASLAATLPTPKTVKIREKQDVRILNFFLMVEEVLKGFYANANKAAALDGELAQFARVAFAHEAKHVKWLRKLLGPRARAKPALDLGAEDGDGKRFVKDAIRLEEANVSAYLGQMANLSQAGRVVAARMVSVDARHAAWIHDIAGMPPADMTINKPMSETEVLSALKRTGFLRSS